MALDDADDFERNSEQENIDEDPLESSYFDEQNSSFFHEVVPLKTDFSLDEQRTVTCEPLSKDILPNSLYMLVDKTVELDIKPLSEFPELGFLEDDEKTRKALCLFTNQRSAKRNCGRTQRVIKIPDAAIFELSRSFLLDRGITRLVLEGSLFALDIPEE